MEKETLYKTEVHLYEGKQLKRTLPDGTKIFKLLFNVGGSYPFTLDAFEGIDLDKDGNKKEGSLSLKDLEEGEYYKVNFRVKTNAFEARGKWHDNRNVMDIKPSSVEEKDAFDKEQSSAPSPKPVVQSEESEENVVEFVRTYKINCAQHGRNVSVEDCIKQYFYNKYEQQWETIQNIAVRELAMPEEDQLE